jgi:galactokinase
MDGLLFRRASHIVGENARVRSVAEALSSGDLDAVGAALNASHESSRVNFENSIPELDTLVELVTSQPAVYGARLTGGGFGGAVMALTNESFGASEVAMVKQAYRAKHGLEATVFHTRAGQGARLV